MLPNVAEIHVEIGKVVSNLSDVAQIELVNFNIEVHNVGSALI